MSLLRNVRSKEMKPWVWFIWGFVHPLKAYAPVKVDERVFWFNYFSWLIHRLLPEQAWLSKESTPSWAAILVMDAIRRYFDLNTSLSLLGKSLEGWNMMVLVIKLDTILSLWDCRSWKKKWLSEIQDDGATGHPHMPRNMQGNEVSPEQNIFFADPSNLHTSPNFSSQTTTGPKFLSISSSSILNEEPRHLELLVPGSLGGIRLD